MDIAKDSFIERLNNSVVTPSHKRVRVRWDGFREIEWDLVISGEGGGGR